VPERLADDGWGFSCWTARSPSASAIAYVGDTETVVLAGLLGGVPVIGYANKPGKAEALAKMGARAVVTDLAEITTAVRTTPSAALPN
jgi:phosphoglycolate phosphatase-like HAD superfamily hydrolase